MFRNILALVAFVAFILGGGMTLWESFTINGMNHVTWSIFTGFMFAGSLLLSKPPKTTKE